MKNKSIYFLSLLMLIQAKSIYSFSENYKFFGGLTLGSIISHIVYIQYQNRTFDKKINNLQKMVESLSNTKDPLDNPKDISEKWGMKGWRLENGDFSFPGIKIPDANTIYLNEPKIVECLYNDLGFRDIYLVSEEELIQFDFVRPAESAYKQPIKDAQNKPLVLVNSDKVPSLNTLKNVKNAINKEIKQLYSQLNNLEDNSPLKIEYSKILIDVCKSYQKTEAYSNFIEDSKSAIDNEDVSENYKNSYKDLVSKLKEIDVKNVSDLYLFNSMHLREDVKSPDGQLLNSCIKNRFVQNCLLQFNDKNSLREKLKNKISNIKWVGKVCDDYLFVDNKIYDELFSKFAITYFEIAVSYARLVRLEKVINKLINLASGFSENISNIDLVKKQKEEINKKINDIIDIVNFLIDVRKIDYIELDDIQIQIKNVFKSIRSNDLVKIYGDLLFVNRLNGIYEKICNDIKKPQLYFSCGDDDNMLGMFGGMRPQKPQGNATGYIEGNLNDIGLINLKNDCKGWLIGLNNLEKLSNQ